MKNITMASILIVLMVTFSGCGSRDAQTAPAIDGRGFGGTNQVTSALQAGRDRLVTDISANSSGISCDSGGSLSSDELSKIKAALHRLDIAADDSIQEKDDYRLTSEKARFSTAAYEDASLFEQLRGVALAATELAGVDGSLRLKEANCLADHVEPQP